MTYGTKLLKNGKRTGYLCFDTGKKVFLNEAENWEMQCKLRFAEMVGIDKERTNNGKNYSNV